MKPILKVMIVIFFISILSACSKTPSAGDIKKNITHLFSECKSVEVSNVQKINGIEVDEKTYKVKFSFDISVTPLNENKNLFHKIDSLIEASEKLTLTIENYSDDFKKQENTLRDQIKLIRNEIQKNFINFGYSDKEKEMENEITGIEIKIESLKREMVKGINEKYKDLEKETGFNSVAFSSGRRGVFDFIKSKQLNNLDRNCKLNSVWAKDVLSKTVYSEEGVTNALGKGSKSGFTSEKAMLKSDNGWIFDF